MTRTAIGKNTRPSRPDMLGIYLNDHLAGATAGSELAHRVARSHQDREEAISLRRLAAEITQDRSALLGIMALLGVTVRAYKVGAAWIGEKAGRLKFNGSLRARSPLSDLEELELLRLGVEGKAAGWRTLRAQADTDTRLDAGHLDELICRASRQADQLEELRARPPADPADVPCHRESHGPVGSEFHDGLAALGGPYRRPRARRASSTHHR